MFVAELELIESLYVHEYLAAGPGVAVSSAAGFHLGHGHALVFGEHAVKYAASCKVAQAG